MIEFLLLRSPDTTRVNCTVDFVEFPGMRALVNGLGFDRCLARQKVYDLAGPMSR